MNTKELVYLLEIAKEKSISKAAENLYITQPALSLFLSRLEASLGIPLFDRTPGGLVLTYAGERYVLMANKVLKNFRDFEQEVSDINSLRKGRLKVGTSAHIGSLVLPDILSEFNKKYPNVEIQIHEARSGELEHLIEGCSLDIALMHLPLKTDCASYVKIQKERYLMAFSNEHRLNRSLYYKDGEKYPFIDATKASGEKFVLAFPHQRVRQISDRILSNAGIVPDIVLTTSSVQTALCFAGVGLGITFLPESYVSLFRKTNSPTLCYMEDEFEAYWVFVIAYPKGISLSRPASAFIELIKQKNSDSGKTSVFS